MKRLLPCVLTLSCALPALSAQDPERSLITLQAQTQTVVQMQNVVIQADEIVVNSSTEQVSARGNVTLTVGSTSLTLDSLQFRPRTFPSDLCVLAAQETNRGQYAKARSIYRMVVNNYPDSEALDDAKVGIGDAFLREGGEEALAQAELAFLDFIMSFPDSPLLTEAKQKLVQTRERRQPKE